MKHSSQRRGTILIVVAGICGLLISISLAFITEIKSSGNTSENAYRSSICRSMLHAGCMYILEAGRLGYGPNPSLGPPGLANGLIIDPNGGYQP